MKQENVLDFNSLKTTHDELVKVGQTELAGKIEHILKNNELPKPNLHNKKHDLNTGLYNVTLNAEEIEIIQDIFLSLEAENVSEDGDTKPLASFYSDLVNKWGHIFPKTN